ncbi:MAG: hypothetical protein ACR2ND_06070 [Solirubrobacteraceae bacterium]
MIGLLAHARRNAIAYVALFVALGGTSYAAATLPDGSVGNQQLRNHSITPVKLDRNAIGGYVRYWARVSADGKLIASRPRAQVLVWYKPPSSYAGGQLRWPGPVPANCFSMATVETFPTAGYASAVTVTGRKGFGTQVRVGLSSSVPVNVAVVCPQP